MKAATGRDGFHPGWRRRDIAQESRGVREREFTPIEVFKRGVGFLGHQVADKRCLA